MSYLHAFAVRSFVSGLETRYLTLVSQIFSNQHATCLDGRTVIISLVQSSNLLVEDQNRDI